jgi:Tfp pilus assembly protein PilF
MKSFLETIFRHKKTAALLPCVLVAAAILLTRHHPHRISTNPNVTEPVFAVEALQKWDPKSLFFTISARNYLAANKPAWISAHDSQQDLQGFSRAGQDPSYWRRLDHEYHFDAVLLCGDPEEYHNLLEHLIVTKDWTLVYLDQTSMIFRRAPAKAWAVEDFHALQQRVASYPAIDRVYYLTQSASKLLAIGLTGLAKQQLDESLRLDKDYPETWRQLALYQMQSGNAGEAEKNIDHALKLDKNNLPALATKAQIFYSTRRFGEALQISEQVVNEMPDDPGALFFHAKIAHEAHAYSQEITTLQHLIEVVLAQHQSVAGFRIYLAQAYARDGQAQPSLDEFQKALDEGGLSDEQVKFIKDTMKSIKDQTSL